MTNSRIRAEVHTPFRPHLCPPEHDCSGRHCASSGGTLFPRARMLWGTHRRDGKVRGTFRLGCAAVGALPQLTPLEERGLQHAACDAAGVRGQQLHHLRKHLHALHLCITCVVLPNVHLHTRGQRAGPAGPQVAWTAAAVRRRSGIEGVFSTQQREQMRMSVRYQSWCSPLLPMRRHLPSDPIPQLSEARKS